VKDQALYLGGDCRSLLLLLLGLRRINGNRQPQRRDGHNEKGTSNTHFFL
jgi:hypothetical protein